MRVRALLTAAAMATAAAYAPAAGAQAPVAASAPQTDSPALLLARLVVPLEAFIAAELELARAGILKLPELDKDAEALEKEYPGVHAAMWTAMEPEMRVYLNADVPNLWKSLVGVYEEMLSPREIRALRDFYATPTGQRMIHNNGAKSDPTALLQAAIAGTGLTPEAFNKSNAEARAAFAKTVSEADRPALDQLGAAVPPPKLHAVGQQVMRVTLAWINKEDPAFDARLEGKIGPMIEKFMAEADARR
jgi:hypothetical protein